MKSMERAKSFVAGSNRCRTKDHKASGGQPATETKLKRSNSLSGPSDQLQTPKLVTNVNIEDIKEAAAGTYTYLN